ncbi:PAS domain-containing protein [Siccirubricoccus deserti]
MVWSATPDGRLLFPGDWAALTGQPAAEAAGWGWLAALHPEDREPVRRQWGQALRTGALYSVEYRIARPEGGWRWTVARGVPLRDAAGEIREWVGTNTDIEDRRRAEAALRASEARFRTLAEAMPHLVWQTDARGEPEYVNARWQTVTGRSLAETRDGGWLAALHPEDAVPLAAAWGRALAEGGECDADLRILCVTGEYRWHRLCAAPVHDAAGVLRHWVGTCSDIDARHQAEARLRHALEAQDALVREAEHRIRNSLQLVASLLRLQAGRVTEPAAREALEAATVRVQAVAEAHRALQLGPDLRSLRLADMLREWRPAPPRITRAPISGWRRRPGSSSTPTGRSPGADPVGAGGDRPASWHIGRGRSRRGRGIGTADCPGGGGRPVAGGVRAGELTLSGSTKALVPR